MSNFVHIITDASVMVLDTTNGEQVKFFSGEDRYQIAVELIHAGREEEVFELDTKTVITNFFELAQEDDSGSVTVSIEDGVGYVYLHAFEMKVELHQAITARVIKMASQGFDPIPMTNFISNLYSNPSKIAVDELFLFIEQCELPITEDGCFIAYKIVRNDYLDIYSGTMDNSIGNTLSMPRNMVDDNRNNTCSQGLHFCSRNYLRHYGSSSASADRCLLVKINPMDVVSIPSDYNNAKGRTWLYEVVGEVEGTWRDTLPTEDYTTASVVGNDGQTYSTPCDDCECDLDECYDECECVLGDCCESVDEDGYSNGFADGYSTAFHDAKSKEDTYDMDMDDRTDAYVSGYENGYVEGISDFDTHCQGYLSGYRDGAINAHANVSYSGVYGEGYELGYKHGKGHTKKLYK